MNSDSASIVLPITRIEQGASYWCWAACGEMLGRYFGQTFKQCEVINRCFGATTACTDPNSVNVPVSPERIGPELAGWGIHNSYYNQGVHESMIVSELQANRPIIAMIALRPSDSTEQGVYHAVVIAGHRNSGMVYKIDPWFGAGVAWIQLADTRWEASWAQIHI